MHRVVPKSVSIFGLVVLLLQFRFWRLKFQVQLWASWRFRQTLWVNGLNTGVFSMSGQLPVICVNGRCTDDARNCYDLAIKLHFSPISVWSGTPLVPFCNCFPRQYRGFDCGPFSKLCNPKEL